MTPLHQTALLMVITSSPQLWQQHREAGDLLQHTVPFFRRLVLTLMVNIICGVVHGVYVNLSQWSQVTKSVCTVYILSNVDQTPHLPGCR